MEEGALSQYQCAGVSRTWTDRWVRKAGNAAQVAARGDERARGTLSIAERLTWLGHTWLAVLRSEGRGWASNECWRVKHMHGTIIKEERTSWESYVGGCPLSLVRERLILPLKSWQDLFVCFKQGLYKGVILHWKIPMSGLSLFALSPAPGT